MIKVSVEINGAWRNMDAVPGMELTLERVAGSEPVWRAALVNRSGKTVRFGGFRFEGVEFPGVPGERLRVYLESWTAVSPAGTRRFGQANFASSPAYRPFAVVDPAGWKETPNFFSAANVAVLNDRDGRSLLVGFITTGEQMTRIDITLEDAGLGNLSAFSLGDDIELDDGETIHSEELLVLEGADGWTLLERYAELWGGRMKTRITAPIPTGWCSWYYYYRNITERDMRENLAYLAAHREEFPIEYFQIDDGYQPAAGDWLEPSAGFPRGIGPLLREIVDAGFKPALWFGPFMVQNTSRLFAEHPEWLIRNAGGEILYPINWRGIPTAILDCTIPEVCDFLRDLFRRAREFGCRYVKLDFMMYECATPGGVYADRKATRAQALRRGLEAIRQGIGGDGFMLGGTMVLGPAAGIVDGERIGADITPYWDRPDQRPCAEAPSVPNACRNIICRTYMHKRLWLNDPDVHIARLDNNKLTESEVKLWTTALYLAGGMTLLSDRFSTLTPERAALSKLLLAEQDVFEVRPLDLFDRDYPSLWYGKRRKDGLPVLGVFNFGDEAETHRLELGRLLAPATAFKDFWSGKVWQGNNVEIELPPHSCLLFEPRP